MNAAVKGVLAAASSQVGYHEGRNPDGHWNNKEKFAEQVPTLAWVSAGGYPWCAVFVCWAFWSNGLLALVPGGATAAVEHIRDAAKASGQFVRSSPRPGDIILYGPTGGDHVGIVESVSRAFGTVTTLEGNTNTNGSAEGDGVYRKTHALSNSWIYGYARPAWPTRKTVRVPKQPTAAPALPPAPPVEAPKHRARVSLKRVQYSAMHDPRGRQGATSHPKQVLIVERALVAEGLLDKRWCDGSFGTLTLAAYRRWQETLGYRGQDADGIPGVATLTALGARHGFEVRS